MKSNFVYLFLLAISTVSCADFYYDETEVVIDESIQKEQRIKDTIMSHIIKTFDAEKTYNSINFGELYVLKPEEIKELDKLIAKKNNIPLYPEKYNNNTDSALLAMDVEINKKKDEIKAKKVYPWYEINHLFSLNYGSDSAQVFEFDFELFPNYTIKDVHQKMAVKLNGKQTKTFERFIDQTPLYESMNYSWANEKNASFYESSFEALEAEENNKDLLLLNILKMVDYISAHNEFDEDEFTSLLVKDWEKQYILNDFESIKVSKLAPHYDSINDIKTLTGYNKEHEIKSADSEPSKLIYLFDLNFVIVQVTEELTPTQNEE